MHKTKEGIVTLWLKNVLMSSLGGKKKKNIFFVHSLLILELLVCEIFSWNVFLLGHKGCRLVHSIPNLPNSSVSWVYIFLCTEQVPVHKQASKEQYTNVGPYLSVLPCLSCVQPTWQIHFCFSPATSTGRYSVFAFCPPAFFFFSLEGYCDL